MRVGLALVGLGVVGVIVTGAVETLGPWADVIRGVSIVAIALGVLIALLSKVSGIGGGLVTLLVGVGGLITGGMVDLGRGWDPGLNVAATALAAIGAAVALYGLLDEGAASDSAIVLTSTATGGPGAGVTLIVALNSFTVPTWLWLVLVALTVIAFALVLPGIGYIVVSFAGDPDTITEQAEVSEPAIGGTMALCFGTYAFVVALGLSLETGWEIICYALAVVLLVITAGAYTEAVHEAVKVARSLKLDMALPPVSAPVAPSRPAAQPAIAESLVIAEVLTRLAANPDRVYALLPRRR